MNNFIMPMILWAIFVGFLLYFTVIVPGKKKNKEVRKMHDSVEVGDEIVTISGVIGIVKERNDEYLLIEIDPNGTCMRALIYAVQSIKKKYSKE